MADTINVRGHSVDLETVYQRMLEEAREVGDGRLVHGAGLKYILAALTGLHADSGTPRQPLREIREQVVRVLQDRGWIKEAHGKNNGRYELLRGRAEGDE